MASLRQRRLLTLASLWLFACGDPQLDESFRGVPLFSIKGSAANAGTSTYQSPRMAVFFTRDLAALDPAQWVEQIGTAIPVQVPSSYVLSFFETPSDLHMLRNLDGTSAGYAMGRVLVYDDLDLNGQHTAGEPFIGIIAPSAVYYISQDLGAHNPLTNGPIAAGFYNVFVPQPCGIVPPVTNDSGTCGVPLGDHCDVDADCNGGLCLKETKLPWPAGYCIIPEPPANGCRPAQAVFSRAPKFSLTPQAAKAGMYLRACTTDADCARPKDRDQGLYHCEAGIRACMPAVSTLLTVGGRFEVEPFCAQ